MSLEQKLPTRKLHVAVLMGGASNERAVSLSTGAMIAQALDPEKYLVATVDTRDMVALTANVAGQLPPPSNNGRPNCASDVLPIEIKSASTLTTQTAKEESGRPDIVFIALHGKGGEDGTIQGALELMGIPYTGSGVLASALAMNKRMSKQLFRMHGLPVIEERVVERKHAPSETQLLEMVQAQFGDAPLFVKPSSEGSTFGCSLVMDRAELYTAVTFALQFDEYVLVERYVQGKEITVGILEDPEAPEGLKTLPVIEIIPKNAYYDYESKYSPGGSEHIIPARLSEAQTQQAQELARRCHQILGCSGMSRTDLIATEESLYVLEVNTIPGMTPTSLLPQAAESAGIAFPELLDRLIASALSKES